MYLSFLPDAPTYCKVIQVYSNDKITLDDVWLIVE